MINTAILMAMVLTHSAPNAVPAKQLVPAIVRAAARHNVPAELLTRIVMVESRGVAGAYNAVSDDRGLMQINAVTAKAYGFMPKCLKNWKCNLDAAAIILSDMRKLDGFRECVYNVGPRGRLEKYKAACERYEQKLASL